MNRIALRRGLSLLELLIAVSIIAILIALLLTGTQKVRAATAEIKTKNNLRQLVLAVNQLASDQDKISGLSRIQMQKQPIYTEKSIFTFILPYTYGVLNEPGPNATKEEIENYAFPPVACYLDESDTSLTFPRGNDIDNLKGRCSYVCNIITFNGVSSFPLHVSDGLHQTVAFTTRYYWTGETRQTCLWKSIFPKSSPTSTFRRATFADEKWDDVIPVTDAATHVTRPSVPGLTFQVQPLPPVATSTHPIAFHRSGLTTAFFDGSVRTISPSVSENVFWALVTPNGGEVIIDY